MYNIKITASNAINGPNDDPIKNVSIDLRNNELDKHINNDTATPPTKSCITDTHVVNCM